MFRAFAEDYPANGEPTEYIFKNKASGLKARRVARMRQKVQVNSRHLHGQRNPVPVRPTNQVITAMITGDEWQYRLGKRVKFRDPYLSMAT